MYNYYTKLGKMMVLKLTWQRDFLKIFVCSLDKQIGTRWKDRLEVSQEQMEIYINMLDTFMKSRNVKNISYRLWQYKAAIKLDLNIKIIKNIIKPMQLISI